MTVPSFLPPTDDIKKAAQDRLKQKPKRNLDYNFSKGLLPDYGRQPKSEAVIKADVSKQIEARRVRKRGLNPVGAYLTEKSRYNKSRGF